MLEIIWYESLSLWLLSWLPGQAPGVCTELGQRLWGVADDTVESGNRRLWILVTSAIWNRHFSNRLLSTVAIWQLIQTSLHVNCRCLVIERHIFGLCHWRIRGGVDMFSGFPSSRQLSVNTYFAWSDISLSSGGISMTLAADIPRSSGNCWKVFRVRGQRSRS